MAELLRSVTSPTAKPHPSPQSVDTAKPYPSPQSVDTAKPYPSTQSVDTAKPYPSTQSVDTAKPYPSPQSVDPVVTTLFYMFQGSKEITASSIVSLITELIPAIQKLVVGGNRGAYKKQVLINVLHLLVDESSIENKESIRNIVDTTVPPMVDTMISIANGKFDLFAQETVKNCCKIS